MSLYAGDNSGGDKIVHITSGVRSETELKANTLQSDTIWHSREMHLTVVAYSAATIGTGAYTTYTFSGLSTPPAGTTIITLAQMTIGGDFVNFDGLVNVIKPKNWDTGTNFTAYHFSGGVPYAVYRFLTTYDATPPSEIVMNNTGVYFGSVSTLKKKILIIAAADLPTGFASELDLPYLEAAVSKRFIVTSSSISSVEVTKNTISAKNSSGNPLITADGRELSVAYATSIEARAMSTGRITQVVSGVTYTLGHYFDVTVSPSIPGQTIKEVALSGDFYSHDHIGAEEVITTDSYGNSAAISGDIVYPAPPVGYSITVTTLAIYFFGANLYIYSQLGRVSDTVFRFYFYHYCTNTPGRNYCHVGPSGGFSGTVRFLS
jgi:hypothetical protein